MVGGKPGIRKGGDVLRRQHGIQLDDCTRGRLQEVGHPSIDGDTGKRLVDTMHVITGSTGTAETTGDERMHNNGIPDCNMAHRRADLVNPACVLMPKGIWEHNVRFLRPLALDNMEVGAAKPGSPDADDDIVGTGDPGFSYFLNNGKLFIVVQTNCFHIKSSMFNSSAPVKREPGRPHSRKKSPVARHRATLTSLPA